MATKSTKKIRIPTNMLLYTKLTLPEIKGKVIERKRLLELLHKNTNRDIILIIADAGYGKTTLVGQWAKQFDQQAVFYSLSEEDSNFDLFINHLIAGFEQLKTNFLKRTKELVLRNKELRNNLEKNGLLSVQQYDWSNVSDRLVEIYKSAMKE